MWFCNSCIVEDSLTNSQASRGFPSLDRNSKGLSRSPRPSTKAIMKKVLTLETAVEIGQDLASAIITRHPPFTVTHVSDRWVKLCGIPKSEVIGQEWSSLMTGPCTDRIASAELMQKAETGGSGRAVLVHYIRMKHNFLKTPHLKVPPQLHHDRVALGGDIAPPRLKDFRGVIIVPQAHLVSMEAIHNSKTNVFTHLCVELIQTSMGEADDFSICARQRLLAFGAGTRFSKDCEGWQKQGGRGSESKATGRTTPANNKRGKAAKSYLWDKEETEEEHADEWGQFVAFDTSWIHELVSAAYIKVQMETLITIFGHISRAPIILGTIKSRSNHNRSSSRNLCELNVWWIASTPVKWN